MQLDFMENNRDTLFIDNNKADWKRPVISRIDIKRTLAGVSGASDGSTPEP